MQGEQYSHFADENTESWEVKRSACNLTTGIE